jgi:hypothetical protein
VRLGKSGCVQFQFTESLLVTAVWVVPDGNLPARKPGLALLRAKALAEPRILGLLRLQTPNPNGHFSRERHAFLLELHDFTRISTPETGFAVICDELRQHGQLRYFTSV